MNKSIQIFLLACSLFLLGGCSTKVTSVSFSKVSFDTVANKTLISAIDETDQTKITNLTTAIVNLAPYIDKNEAAWVAREAVLYPQHLANQYKLMSPPIYHNKLVNAGKRKKGLCYHWARDMDSHLGSRQLKTLEFRRAVAYQGLFFEHNTITVAAKKSVGLGSAIVLDPWRNSGTLFWSMVSDDPKYYWKRWYPGKVRAK